MVRIDASSPHTAQTAIDDTVAPGAVAGGDVVGGGVVGDVVVGDCVGDSVGKCVLYR